MIDPMIIKEITAHHEAAHAVLTHISKFHSLIGVIRLHSEDIGGTFVSLSKKKLARAGKPTGLEILTDPDYVEDASVIYLAGFAAELHYCKLNARSPENYIVNRTYSNNDYETVKELVAKAGLPKGNVSFYEKQAAEAVARNWRHIQGLAGLILKSDGGTLDAVDAMDYLDSVFGTYSLYPIGRVSKNRP